MFENFPISGFAICYGPLALTIIGFIVFAAMTDADARRTYLRRPHLRGKSMEATRTVTAETPSGAVVTIKPSPTAEAPAAQVPPAPAAPASPLPANPDEPTEEV